MAIDGVWGGGLPPPQKEKQKTNTTTKTMHRKTITVHNETAQHQMKMTKFGSTFCTAEYRRRITTGKRRKLLKLISGLSSALVSEALEKYRKGLLRFCRHLDISLIQTV